MWIVNVGNTISPKEPNINFCGYLLIIHVNKRHPLNIESSRQTSSSFPILSNSTSIETSEEPNPVPDRIPKEPFHTASSSIRAP